MTPSDLVATRERPVATAEPRRWRCSRSRNARAHLVIAGAVGEERAEHPGGIRRKGGDEHLEELVQVAEGAAGVWSTSHAESPSQGGEDPPLASRPAAVDRGFVVPASRATYSNFRLP
jgi:hypothetical protein